MKLNKIAAAVLLVSFPANALAQGICIPRNEAETLVTAMQPSVIESVRDGCTPHLPAGTPLIARGDTMATRYSAAAEGARPAATAIASQLVSGGDDDIPDWIPGTALLDTFEAAISVAVTQDLNSETCAIANDLFVGLEPLPASNFASILTSLWAIGSNDDDAEPGDAPFRICPRG